MVSLIKYGALSGGEKYNTNILEIDGLSTDIKPITTFIEYGVDGREIGRTNIENGSTFTEIDTGKLFMYDAENTVWYEIVTSGDGGGGGTDNYNSLSNKPQINGTVLSGNKTSDSFGLQNKISATNKIDSDFVDDENSANKFMSKEEKTQIITNKNGIASLTNSGAKNLANFKFAGVVPNVNVKSGTVVCTENNGVFSFSGTADDKNYAAYILKQFLLKAGTYKISGVSGGSNTTYWMRIGRGETDTGLFNFYDGEREFNLVSDTLITVQIVIYANQTISNLIFEPMIRDASIEDSTYQPYAPTNRELYEMILSLQSGG